MNICTEEELLSILKETEGTDISFGETERERILDNPYLNEMLVTLKEFADGMRGKSTESIPFSTFMRFYEDGDRTQFELAENGYFSRRGKLATFAYLSWLYGREEDIKELENIMWVILDEYVWALPAHLPAENYENHLQEDGEYTIDLFSAETAEALAEIISLLEDKLHPILVKRVRKLIEERIFHSFKHNFWWKRTSNNWAAVCSGSVGICAMYEMRDTESLSKLLYSCLQIMQGFMRGFYEDGACSEGTDYWSYGFGYFICFAEALYRRTKGKINLFDNEDVHKVAVFQQKCFFKSGLTLPFSDCGGTARFNIVTVGGTRKFYDDVMIPPRELTNTSFPFDGCYRFALLLRNFVWADDFKDSASTAKVGFGTYIFDKAQWYISNSENGASIAAKAGHNAESHNHNDVGSFAVFRNGVRFIDDIGRGEYTKAYFSSDRYTLINNSSRSHNVPIINGIYQHEGAEYAAKNTEISKDGICCDIAGAYPVPELKYAVRKLTFDDKNGSVKLCDTFASEEGKTLQIKDRLVTRIKPQIFDDRIEIDNKGMTLTVVPHGARISLSSEPFTYIDITQTVYYIDFECEICGTGTIEADMSFSDRKTGLQKSQ